MSRAKIIPIVNQKGGCGKTTVCRSLAYMLHEDGYQILMIDMDPQGNLGSSLFSAKEVKQIEQSGKKTMYDVLTHQAMIKDCILQTSVGDIVLSSNLMYGLYGTPLIDQLDFEAMREDPAAVYDFVKHRYEMQQDPATDDRHLLCRAMASVLDDYDYVLIDTNPNLGFLSTLSLLAYEEIYPLIPVFPEESSRKSVLALHNTLQMICRNELNQKITVLGLLVSRFERTLISKQYVHYLGKVAKKMDTILFDSKIPKGIVASESMAMKKSIFEINRKSSVAEAYQEFYTQFKKRMSQLTEED